MPGIEFLTAASITVIPGSASTTRSVPSCKIYVILAMALARLASLQSWETSGGRHSPAPVAAGADGTSPRTWRVSYRAIETETPAPSAAEFERELPGCLALSGDVVAAAGVG